MAKFAVCSTNIEFNATQQELIKDRLQATVVDFFYSRRTLPEYFAPSQSSCYALLGDIKKLEYYNLMLVCHQKKKYETIIHPDYYTCCIFINDASAIRHLNVPHFIEEHAIYGRVRNLGTPQHSLDTDFFFADTMAFNIVCDAYRLLKLGKEFVCNSDITSFFYRYIKMNEMSIFNANNE